MSKLTHTIFSPKTGEGGEAHPSDEELASLAEGSLHEAERDRLARHVTQCSRCHRIVAGIVAELEADEARSWFARNTKQLMAIAAALIVAVALGGGLYYHNLSSQQTTLTASLPLDPGLRNLVMEGSEEGWETGDVAARLVAELQKRRLQVGEARRVIMVAQYTPTKDLLGPPEVLKIRIKDGVICLEVVPAPPEPEKK